MATLYAIYGGQGVGKTSSAYLCNKPFVIDCEKSVERSLEEGRCLLEGSDSILKITNLQDVMNFLPNAEKILQGRKNVFIDTVGALYEIISTGVIARGKSDTNQKNNTAIKSIFNSVINTLDNLKCCENVVLFAHEDELGYNENKRKIYKMRAGTSSVSTHLAGTAYAVGRISSDGETSFIDFNDPEGSSVKYPDSLRGRTRIAIRTAETDRRLKNGEVVPPVLQEQLFNVVHNAKLASNVNIENSRAFLNKKRREINELMSVKEVEDYIEGLKNTLQEEIKALNLPNGNFKYTINELLKDRKATLVANAPIVATTPVVAPAVAPTVAPAVNPVAKPVVAPAVEKRIPVR